MKFLIDESIKYSSGVYMIIDVKTKDTYIGSTSNFFKRFSSHVSRFKTGSTCSPLLIKHVNSKGSDDLEFRIIKRCSPKEMGASESYEIMKRNPSLNINSKIKKKYSDARLQKH